MTTLSISVPQNPPLQHGPSAGYTLLEVIAVLLILTVLGAVALSGHNTGLCSLTGESDALKGHLRYAQLRAMNDTIPWQVLVTDTGYTLNKNTTPALLPGEDTATHTFAGGVIVTSGTITVTFDNWGSPGATDLAITLGIDTDTRTISIAKDTGFIP